MGRFAIFPLSRGLEYRQPPLPNRSDDSGYRSKRIHYMLFLYELLCKIHTACVASGRWYGGILYRIFYKCMSWCPNVVACARPDWTANYRIVHTLNINVQLYSGWWAVVGWAPHSCSCVCACVPAGGWSGRPPGCTEDMSTLASLRGLSAGTNLNFTNFRWDFEII